MPLQVVLMAPFSFGFVAPSLASPASLASAHFKSSSQLIDSVIDLHHSLQTHDDWHDAGLTPENILRHFRSLAFRPNYSEQTCQKLKSLKAYDLNLFADAIEAPITGDLLHCQTDLLGQIEENYALSQVHIQKKLIALKKKSLGASPDQPLVVEKNVHTTAGPVFFDADLPSQHVALTFDDGPHPSRTPRLLDILSEAGVRVTFFSVGQNIRRMPEIMNRIVSEGHSVGTHSYTHPDLRKLSRQAGEAQIFDAVWELVKAVGFSDPFFRFPYGARTTHLQNQVKQAQIGTFFWNIDTLDWKEKDPDRLYDYALRQVEKQGRGIVLFHDIQRQTIEMMPFFLQALKLKGYRFVVFRSPDTITPESGLN